VVFGGTKGIYFYEEIFFTLIIHFQKRMMDMEKVS